MPLPLSLPLVYEGGMALTTLVGALYLEENSEQIADSFNGLAESFKLPSDGGTLIDDMRTNLKINDYTLAKISSESLAELLSETNIHNLEDSVKRLSASTLQHIEDSIKEASIPDETVLPIVSPMVFTSAKQIIDNKEVDDTDTLLSVMKAAAQLNASQFEEHNKILNNINLAIQALISTIYQVSDRSLVQQTLQTSVMAQQAKATANSSAASSDVSVTNQIDISGVESAIASLGETINTSERQRYHVKSADLAEYKTTSKEHTDILGNDAVTATPAEIATMKDISKAKGDADENDFELDNDLFDTFPDLTKLADLFAYEGLHSDIDTNFRS